MRDFFDPPWEETNVILIDESVLRQAERRLYACEACNPEETLFLFDHLLDLITGHDPRFTDYVLVTAAHCPRCGGEILEKTEVAWTEGDSNVALPPTGCVKTEQ
jgi:hypothetical protein